MLPTLIMNLKCFVNFIHLYLNFNDLYVYINIYLRSLLMSSLIDLLGDGISHLDLLGVESSSSQQLREGVLISETKMSFINKCVYMYVTYINPVNLMLAGEKRREGHGLTQVTLGIDM